MAGNFNLRAIISATDNLSPALRRISRNVQGFRRQLQAASRGATIQAAGFGIALAAPLKAFGDLENSTAILKNSLTDKNGLAPGLAAVNAEVLKLGNQLPGTTAEFGVMAAKLHGYTIEADSIANGVLRASAYLAVANAGFGVTSDGAVEAVGKMGNGFKLAKDEYVDFADNLSRASAVNIPLDGLTLSSSKLIGLLQVLGLTGLKVSKQMTALQGIPLAKGLSPEVVGSGLKRIIEAISEHRKIKNIETDVIGFLDKINHRVDRQAKLTKLFGDDWQIAAMITKDAFVKTNASMENQSSLLQKVGVLSDTLNNKTESLSGSIVNLGGSIGNIYAPQVKQLSDYINEHIPTIQQWVTDNKKLIENVLLVTAAITGARVATQLLSVSVGVLSAVSRLNPWIVGLQLAAGAVALLYNNWDKFMKLYNSSVNGLSDFFMSVDNFFSKSSNASMRLPSQQSRNSLLKAGSNNSHHVVEFANAPAGMRVVAGNKDKGNASVNVGYRTIGGASGAW